MASAEAVTAQATRRPLRADREAQRGGSLLERRDHQAAEWGERPDDGEHEHISKLERQPAKIEHRVVDGPPPLVIENATVSHRGDHISESPPNAVDARMASAQELA